MKIKGTVQATSAPKEWNGMLQIGFKIGEKWYNASGDENNLKRIREIILKKGNEIEFEFDKGEKLASDLKVLVEAKEEPKEKKTESKKKGFEDDIVNFEELLSAAHNKKAPFSIKTEMLSIDVEKKYALFKATVEVFATEEQYKKYCIGELKEESKNPVLMKLAEFTGHGDATADNITGDHIKKHFIRMAETRAIVRALRWYTNNATCAEEEK